MTDKQKIIEILKAYTKKNNISASSVILEEYAEELLANGVKIPIRCKDCMFYKHTEIGNCMACVRQTAYKKPNDFCSSGIKEREGK